MRRSAPSSPPFAALAERLGIDLDAPVELEPVTGPLVDGCERLHEEDGCRGQFRLVDRNGPVWTACCDACRAEAGIPARRLDPQIRRERLLARAGLPEAFAARRFDRDAENASVLKALRDWRGGFDRSGPSLLPAPALFGLPGRGKTHLLVAMCRRVIEECDLAVAFYSARGLLRDLQRFDSDVVRGEAWTRATTVDVLALDDLGAEQTTDWRLDQLGHLIDERYQRELPILVATNYPPSQWERVLDARTVSRLRQMTFPLELGGRDRRQGRLEAA